MNTKRGLSLAFVLITCVFWGNSDTVAARPSQQTDPSASSKDSCLQKADHAACLQYYRGLCLGKDPQGCLSYTTEIEKDCPTNQPPPNATPDQLKTLLQCRRRAQCWEDRSLGIHQMLDACAADADSDTCKQAKTRFASVTPLACDKVGDSSVF